MSNEQWYLDMDGVTADFHEASMSLHGLPVDKENAVWNFFEPHLTFEEFWIPLRNEQFWIDLPVMEDGRELVERLLAELGEERLTICSNAFCLGSPEGKRIWLKKHFPTLEPAAIFSAKKHRLAAPCKTLIDDHDDNCKKFIAHTGRAVVVPRSWNSRKGDTKGGGRFDPAELAREILSYRSKA